MTRYTLPDLHECLHSRDFGFLKIVAEFWGIVLDAPDARSGLKILLPALTNSKRLGEIIDNLPSEARAAFIALQKNQGTFSWPLFCRQFGELREFGAARRDREQPYRNPVSVTEILWYRGLIGRGFFDSTTGPQELAYIPREFAEADLKEKPSQQPIFGKLAEASQHKVTISAGDRILDDAATLLAALRTGEAVETWITDKWIRENSVDTYIEFLRTLLASAGLLDKENIPNVSLARAFLEKNSGAALQTLVQAWQESTLINELRMLPDLIFEGEWQNDSLSARMIILDYLLKAPGQQFGLQSKKEGEGSPNPFINIDSVIQSIREYNPDFQRPAGDYDSWYIRKKSSGEYLRGFGFWDAVEGAYIRFLITGPLFWLGMVDLAGPAGESTHTDLPAGAFRFSSRSKFLLGEGEIPAGVEKKAQCTVRPDGTISMPRVFPLAVRYQIARFCKWVSFDGQLYTCNLTPASLERAAKQDLRVAQLTALLQKYATAFPPALGKTLARWEEFGREISFEKVVVLRVKRPEILQALRTSRAAKYLGDPLGPTAVIVNAGAEEVLLKQLVEMGYLGEINLDEE